MVVNTMHISRKLFLFFFFNDPATTEIYTSSHTLSLHDALPIFGLAAIVWGMWRGDRNLYQYVRSEEHTSELQSRELISYAVFCLKKKKQEPTPTMQHVEPPRKQPQPAQAPA